MVVGRLRLLRADGGTTEEGDRRLDREDSDRWEGVREEEEERRNRACEPAGTSPWRLEELQEPRNVLTGAGVDEHR